MCFKFLSQKQSQESKIFLPSDENNETTSRKTKVNLIHKQSRQNTQKFNQLNKIKKISKDDFNILKQIGQGSNAQIFLVKLKNNSFQNSVFSMKQVPKSHLDQKTSKSKDNILTERSIMTQIQNQFLMPIYFSFQSSQNLFLIMEYMIGGDLFFHKQKSVFFTEEKARFYMCEIIIAIGVLHSQNIIHRDIKLENVMIAPNGHIKLLDYGLAKSNMKLNSEAQTICGTPNYLAPEIILQKKYNKSVDWWQLGVIFYEMLSNQPPFHDQNRKQLLTNIINVEYHMKPNFSPEAQSLISQLLVKDPNKRLGSGVQDANEIKKHSFFKNIKWDDYENLEIEPPFIPITEPNTDTSNFDTDLVNKILKDQDKCNQSISSEQNISGFSYNFQQLSDNNI